VHVFSQNIYANLNVTVASKAHGGADGSKGAEEETCIAVMMMNKLQF